MSARILICLLCNTPRMPRKRGFGVAKIIESGRQGRNHGSHQVHRAEVDVRRGEVTFQPENGGTICPEQSDRNSIPTGTGDGKEVPHHEITGGEIGASRSMKTGQKKSLAGWHQKDNDLWEKWYETIKEEEKLQSNKDVRVQCTDFSEVTTSDVHAVLRHAPVDMRGGTILQHPRVSVATVAYQKNPHLSTDSPCIRVSGLSRCIHNATGTASRDQIHHWFRLCCDTFFTCIFLRSFRHHVRTICRTEMANVSQTPKMIPFVTCEMSLGQYVSKFLVSTYLIWIFGSKLNLSNNQSSATLWVRDPCLIVGQRPLIIILMTASLSSNLCN